MTLEEFMSSIDQLPTNSLGCRLWPHIKKGTGYGRVSIPGLGRGLSTHRLSLSLKLGREIRPSMKALHTCDHRNCINPAHLYEGSSKQNSADAVTRGRIKRGENHPKHKLTYTQVQAIRAIGASLSQREVADKFNVCQSKVGSILRGTRWRDA